MDPFVEVSEKSLFGTQNCQLKFEARTLWTPWCIPDTATEHKLFNLKVGNEFRDESCDGSISKLSHVRLRHKSRLSSSRSSWC